MKDRLQIIALALRVPLGAWFLYSGAEKIFVSGLDRFTYDISNYRMLPAPWDAVIAYTIPWAEVICGVCLLLSILRKGTILAMTGLVISFAIAIGWAWSKNLDITCGCHGGDAPINYWEKALEFTGYFAALGWLWWIERADLSKI
ncbi:DoxX family membrane protein [Luteolibacter pohnpeiensis]|uniref:DoxX family membrane protein n=1 Tax=Luteolibacter pohnpeiensis TaxID=454153 RepID=A0A934VY56_9BACT|nr:MauE/DoxX family redox-associated membrane protein [Luteolibacter pohnpeiensis]MBK1884543.1 DoxX family membrane protein [Luteolibacter pohnpeiensis]